MIYFIGGDFDAVKIRAVLSASIVATAKALGVTVSELVVTSVA